MKRCAIFVVVLCLAISAFAQDQRTIKRDLIRELLKVIDTKTLMQGTLDIIFHEMERSVPMGELKAFRERLYTRIDYAKYSEEVYGPIFDKNFTAAELKDLIAFYKTPLGQKSAKMLPEFGVGSLVRGSRKISELGETIRQEMKDEEKALTPWKQTMADLRTVATAAEAYATDENKYPNAKTYVELAPILSPTYIKKMPEKDVWGTPYLYIVSSDRQHYRFVSAGADRKFDWNAEQIEVLPSDFKGRAMDNLDADIIYQDGMFVQFPAVSQKQQD
jgi:uncharacterized protein